MRLVDPDVIKREEQMFIEALKSVFKFDAFRSYFKDNHNIELTDLYELNGADILVRDNRILFGLDACCKVHFSITLDRYGNFLKVDNSSAREFSDDVSNGNGSFLLDAGIIRSKEKDIIRAIGSSVSSENIKTLYKREMGIALSEEICFEDGKITIHNSAPAYQLVYTAVCDFTILVDKSGHPVELVFTDSQESTRLGT
jgi:hypothetical protein